MDRRSRRARKTSAEGRPGCPGRDRAVTRVLHRAPPKMGNTYLIGRRRADLEQDGSTSESPLLHQRRGARTSVPLAHQRPCAARRGGRRTPQRNLRSTRYVAAQSRHKRRRNGSRSQAERPRSELRMWPHLQGRSADRRRRASRPHQLDKLGVASSSLASPTATKEHGCAVRRQSVGASRAALRHTRAARCGSPRRIAVRAGSSQLSERGPRFRGRDDVALQIEERHGLLHERHRLLLLVG
jgi:hypothetical protein